MLVSRAFSFGSRLLIQKQRLAVFGAVLAACSSIALLLSASLAGANGTIGPKAYVGLFGENAVAVMDTANNQVLSTIPVPNGPHGMVVTPDNRWVYVSSDGASTVSVIDTTLDRVSSNIEVGQSPHGLAITPDGSMVLVAGFGTNMVSAIDTSTNGVMWQVPVDSPHNIAVSPDGLTAYVASQNASAPSLAILSIPDQQQSDTVPLANVPRALNFSPDGTQLWFTEAGLDEVQVLDPTTNDIPMTIPVGASPHHPIFTPDGSLGLVVSQGPGELWLADPATDTTIATVKVGDMPHWIGLSDDGLTAYVTNEFSNDLSVVDLTTASVTDTVPIGNAPRKIVVQTALFSPAPAPVPSVMEVAISQFAFSPDTVTIVAGQQVTWTNNDPTDHTVTSDAPGWDSGPLSTGATFSSTFDTPGTYTYHCSIHPFMHGTVIVTS